MKPVTRLTLDFAQRMVTDLATNNVLRGSWAEQLVAHHLGIDADELPPNWSYYDMRTARNQDVSVKHSTGVNPKFSVEMRQWGWDHKLQGSEESRDGWRGADSQPPQYWCHAYVFARLNSDSGPTLDEVLDLTCWEFAALSREQMYRAFVLNRSGARKTAGLGTIAAMSPFGPGEELADAIASMPIDETDPDVPPRFMAPYPGIRLGVPVNQEVETVPTSEVDDAAPIDT